MKIVSSNNFFKLLIFMSLSFFYLSCNSSDDNEAPLIMSFTEVNDGIIWERDDANSLLRINNSQSDPFDLLDKIDNCYDFYIDSYIIIENSSDILLIRDSEYPDDLYKLTREQNQLVWRYNYDGNTGTYGSIEYYNPTTTNFGDLVLCD